MSEKIRVVIVVSHPIQHFVHLYRALAKESAIDLLVIFASDLGTRSYFDKGMNVEITWKTDLLSGYRSIFLPEAPTISKTGFWSINNPSVSRALNDFNPQVVQTHGYAQLTHCRALFWCKSHGVPALIWSDSELKSSRGLIKRFMKQLVVRPLLGLYSAYLTVGENNEAYLKNYGVSAKRMFRTPFTIDEDGFRAAIAKKDETKTRLLREHLIPDDAFIVLIVGKLIERKRPGDLIEVLRHIETLKRKGKDVYVLFAGDGPLRKSLELQAKGVEDKCRFLGFVNVDKLPDYYVISDALAHISEVDPHPLTNSEAILSGLPLIVSDRIGTTGATDVARPGVNAIVCPCGDIQAIADAIVRLADDRELYERMKNASLQISIELGVEASVRGFLSAVRAVTK
jgi:glycosyltransferase involved in cell wall biosynthesis